ncbi:hypothetical protein ACFYNO_19655 [Kitasatospora sp. NPDC006697]|uniref:hypothetical protein n=1 Tax=Kitasatospora sp. NPDC006697 TaxID=3364020 RepID=UPI0036B30CFC
MNAIPGEYGALAAKNIYEMRQLAGEVGTQNLAVEMETLGDFKKKVDGMLVDLGNSQAAPTTVSRQSVDPAWVGSGFSSADDLHSAYSLAHQNLQALSQTLSNQIEAMSIAMNININGYQNVDDTQRQNLWQIHNQTNTQYTAGVSSTGAVQPPAGPTSVSSNGDSPSAVSSANQTGSGSTTG